jgi:hypothetical protein
MEHLRPAPVDEPRVLQVVRLPVADGTGRPTAPSSVRPRAGQGGGGVVVEASREVGRHNLARVIPEGPWLDWAANLIAGFTLEAVIAWLDAGRPDPDQAADRISQAVHGVMAAAHPTA